MKNLERIFIISIIILGVFLSGCGKKTADSELKTEKISVKFAREVMRGNYRIVTTSELKDWIDQKKDLLIIDTMPEESSYKKNHIPGAFNLEMPIKELKSLDEKKMKSLKKILGSDKNRLIVFYCGFTKCGRSHNGAMWAVKLGYHNVYRHPGGIVGWKEAGYAVEKK